MLFNKYKLNVYQTIKLAKTWMQGVVNYISDIEFFSCEYKKNSDVPYGDERFVPLSGKIPGGKDNHSWIHFKFKTDSAEKYPHHKPYLRVRTSNIGTWDALNPQGMLYLDGHLVSGLDINHTEYPLEFSKEYDAYIYFYTGMNDCPAYDFNAGVQYLDTLIEKLYYDLSVPYDASECFPEDSDRSMLIMKYLEEACLMIDMRNIGSEAFYDSIRKADEFLETEFYGKVCGEDNTLCEKVALIGHTHIDVAWQWTYAQTREKTQRSFANVLSLMNQYPEFKFMSSQAQLYKYLKEEDPHTYERVKEAIKEGRWESEGAMWVEADCNLIGGESMIRQVTTGKKFFKDEFGVDHKILWLPDVFGYSAAMPQILKKAGVTSFVTSKISWNEDNKMPFDTFWWKGIDGSEMFTYFISAQDHGSSQFYTTYVGRVTPSMVLGTWERYQQKDLNDTVMITFGHGDGGGGPTREMLEQSRRIEKGIPGIPKTEMQNPTEFMEKVKENFIESTKALPEVPKWVGELYLENHRGTYTTQAKNKLYNRRCEFLLQRLEALSALDMLFGGSYPKEKIDGFWEGVLLNQFHDVIPGSSIREVYDDTDKMYEEILSEGCKIEKAKLSSVAEKMETKDGVVVYNPNGFESDGFVTYKGEKCYVQSIPALGFKALVPEAKKTEVKVSGKTAENRYFILKLDDCGNIESLYDKRADKEIFRSGEKGNVFCYHEDRPPIHDAWNIDKESLYKKYEITVPAEIGTFSDSVGAGFIVKRTLEKSEIRQKIVLYDDVARVDFETEVSWNEDHNLLRVYFPMNVKTDKATFEIQFGHVERATHSNTTWDYSKFEVMGHKWVDVSDAGYGVSLLNDCKYGYYAEGSDIGLTLLKAPSFPDPKADIGEHKFTYSIYPHEGSFREGGTVEEAYKLNNPLLFAETKAHKGEMGEEYSLVSSDKKNVIIETVKKAEDSDDLIVRLYDAYNMDTKANITFGFDIKEVYIADLMENEETKLEVSGRSVKVPVSNFEIATLKIKR